MIYLLICMTAYLFDSMIKGFHLRYIHRVWSSLVSSLLAFFSLQFLFRVCSFFWIPLADFRFEYGWRCVRVFCDAFTFHVHNIFEKSLFRGKSNFFYTFLILVVIYKHILRILTIFQYSNEIFRAASYARAKNFVSNFPSKCALHIIQKWVFDLLRYGNEISMTDSICVWIHNVIELKMNSSEYFKYFICRNIYLGTVWKIASFAICKIRRTFWLFALELHAWRLFPSNCLHQCYFENEEKKKQPDYFVWVCLWIFFLSSLLHSVDILIKNVIVNCEVCFCKSTWKSSL